MKVFPDRDTMVKAILPPGQIVAEVGVHKGAFAKVLLRQEPARLHLIDLWVTNPAAPPHASCLPDDSHILAEIQTVCRFAEAIRDGTVILHQGYSTSILRLFPDDYLDFLYLDSDHQFAHVYEELCIARRIVKPAGIIAGHDYVEPEDDENARRGNYGVVAAVEKFCDETDWEMFYRTERHLHGPDGWKYPSFGLKRKTAPRADMPGWAGSRDRS